MLNTKKFLEDYNTIDENGGDITITYEGLVKMLEEYHLTAKLCENGKTIHHTDGTVSLPPNYEGVDG